MDLSAYYSQFRDEAVENIRLLGAVLVELEAEDLPSDQRAAKIAAIFRAMHTIKGSARMLGFEAAARLAHVCEHILGAVREERRELTRYLADELLRGGDAVLELIDAQLEGRAASVDVEDLVVTLGRNRQPAAATTPAPPAGTPEVTLAPIPVALTVVPTVEAAPEPTEEVVPVVPTTQIVATPVSGIARQTIRVRVDRLDRLMNLVGELTVAQQTKLAHLEVLASAEALIVKQHQQLLALERELQLARFHPNQRAIISEQLNGALTSSDHVTRMLKSQTEQFLQHVGQTRLLVEDLEQEVITVRLLPVSTLYTTLPRAVRDLARDANKDVNLVLKGEETEVDRKIIEALSDPLLHMIRNAVDHGIEVPDEREQLGKPRQGTVEVQARSVGAYVQISIRDDGRGMDPEKMRQSAIRKRLLTTDAAQALSDHEALELIFLPGFSTAQMITDISGRGVGMDVVRTNVLEIGGQVLIDSQVGQGTTFTLSLPLTLITTRVLLIEIGNQQFALPATGCRATVWAYPEQVRTVEGRAVLPFEGRLAPILRLADLLDVGGAHAFPSRRRAPALIVGSAQRPLALVIDRLVDEREAVVRSLGPLFESQRRFSGALQLGDGRLVLILNPAVLAQNASNMALPAPVARREEQRRYRLLVADDSFTTRELIRSILHAAGYDVQTAVDGVDAFAKLQQEAFDLVVTDVEMPQMDGFDLTLKIRQIQGASSPPVVIVTSLASEAHRRRGLEVGAQAYIVKSQFNQGNLLETIQQLLGE